MLYVVCSCHERFFSKGNKTSEDEKKKLYLRSGNNCLAILHTELCKIEIRTNLVWDFHVKKYVAEWHM
jgi:hypothetical protein